MILTCRIEGFSTASISESDWFTFPFFHKKKKFHISPSWEQRSRLRVKNFICWVTAAARLLHRDNRALYCAENRPMGSRRLWPQRWHHMNQPLFYINTTRKTTITYRMEKIYIYFGLKKQNKYQVTASCGFRPEPLFFSFGQLKQMKRPPVFRLWTKLSFTSAGWTFIYSLKFLTVCQFSISKQAI